uniref:Uncharacterized protein n=1 Tax=Fervidicoccus fontis TaxID=683846 RepID=A0A7J3ZKM6_9CREN
MEVYGIMDEASKNELIEMIVSGGLLEELIRFLERKNHPIGELRSIYDLKIEDIEEFARSKGLLSASEGEGLDDSERAVEEYYEPREIRPRTPPKKSGEKGT